MSLVAVMDRTPNYFLRGAAPRGASLFVTGDAASPAAQKNVASETAMKPPSL